MKEAEIRLECIRQASVIISMSNELKSQLPESLINVADKLYDWIMTPVPA